MIFIGTLADTMWKLLNTSKDCNFTVFRNDENIGHIVGIPAYPKKFIEVFKTTVDLSVGDILINGENKHFRIDSIKSNNNQVRINYSLLD